MPARPQRIWWHLPTHITAAKTHTPCNAKWRQLLAHEISEQGDIDWAHPSRVVIKPIPHQPRCGAQLPWVNHLRQVRVCQTHSRREVQPRPLVQKVQRDLNEWYRTGLWREIWRDMRQHVGNISEGLPIRLYRDIGKRVPSVATESWEKSESEESAGELNIGELENSGVPVASHNKSNWPTRLQGEPRARPRRAILTAVYICPLRLPSHRAGHGDLHRLAAPPRAPGWSHPYGKSCQATGRSPSALNSESLSSYSEGVSNDDGVLGM